MLAGRQADWLAGRYCSCGRSGSSGNRGRSGRSGRQYNTPLTGSVSEHSGYNNNSVFAGYNNDNDEFMEDYAYLNNLEGGNISTLGYSRHTANDSRSGQRISRPLDREYRDRARYFDGVLDTSSSDNLGDYTPSSLDRTGTSLISQSDIDGVTNVFAPNIVINNPPSNFDTNFGF